MATNGKRYSNKEKRAHVKAFRASGETQGAYCEKAGVSRMSLAQWVAAVDKADKAGQRKRRATNGHAAPSLAPLYESPIPPGQPRLVFPPGVTPLGLSREQIKSLIQALTALL